MKCPEGNVLIESERMFEGFPDSKEVVWHGDEGLIEVHDVYYLVVEALDGADFDVAGALKNIIEIWIDHIRNPVVGVAVS